MKPTTALALSALALVARDASSAPAGGTLTGRVQVVENGKAAQRDEVWIYLEHVRPRWTRDDKATLPAREIRQEKEQFSPHVLVVPVGTTVSFPNYDHQEHNVFAPSPKEAPGFDVGRYNTDHKGKSHLFEDTADFQIYCDIHKQMWARVKVVDTDPRLIVKADASGSYTLTGVPAGSYKLHVWTYDSVEIIKKIAVTDGATVTADDAHLQLGKTLTHFRKDGSEYPIYTHP
jgi:plastocyanin